MQYKEETRKERQTVQTLFQDQRPEKPNSEDQEVWEG